MRISPYLDSSAKRCFDLAVCLIVLGPSIVAMIVVAAAVLVCDGRPVVLMQRRAGKGGRVFRMPKFRTMLNGACVRDRQVTRLGGFLRKHRLDELPQLFSVLLGRMSLVGPRPELVDIVAEYRPSHRRRLIANPGLTGLWQVLGTRERNIHEQIGYDLHYLRKANLRMDLRISIRTIRFMIRPKAWQV